MFFWTDAYKFWISHGHRFPQGVKEMAIKAFAVGAGQVNQTLQAGQRWNMGRTGGVL